MEGNLGRGAERKVANFRYLTSRTCKLKFFPATKSYIKQTSACPQNYILRVRGEAPQSVSNGLSRLQLNILTPFKSEVMRSTRATNANHLHRNCNLVEVLPRQRGTNVRFQQRSLGLSWLLLIESQP